MALQEPWEWPPESFPSKALASVMPWEWILENLLDSPEFPLGLMQEIIGYIPHLEKPRCSRLLQKVALRYLDEIVAIGTFNVCAIPLLKFLLKEQGVYNTHKIHSLKESFENDLVLRMETEVVLANLRCGAEASRDWEGYEDALEKVFPEDTCDSSRVKRRQELLAVLQNWFRGEPQKDLSEKLLAKYPFEKLSRDIAHFVEDKMKSFKTKFLDRLAKDLDYGAYCLSSTVDPLATNQVIPELKENLIGDHQVPEILVTGHEKLLQTASCASVDCPEVVHSKIVDVNTAFHIATNSPTPCLTDLRTKAHQNDNDGDCYGLGGLVAGENLSSQDELRQEIALRMDEVDRVASGLTNEMNELMKGVSKFAEGLHKASCIPEVMSFGLDPKNAEGLLSARRDEVNMDIEDTAKDHILEGKHVNDLISLKAALLMTSLMKDTNLVQEHENITTVVADTTLQHISCNRKTGVHDSEEETANSGELGKQGSAWMTNVGGNIDHTGHNLHKHMVDAVDDGGFQCSPNSRTTNSKELVKRKMPVRVEDTDMMIADEDGLDENLHVTFKTRGKRHSRVYLRRMSKERMTGNMKFSAMPTVERVQADSDGYLNAKCYLCDRGGDSQRFCCQCTVSVHESCLLGLSISQTPDFHFWYCPLCANSAALDAVRNANKELLKAKIALKKVSVRASKAKKRLVCFLGARTLSRRSCEDHVDLGQCHNQIHGRNFQGVAPAECSKDLSAQTSVEANKSSLCDSALEKCARQDLMECMSPTTLETPIQVAPQASACDDMNTAQTSPVVVTSFSRDGQSGLSPTSLPPVSERGNQDFVVGGKEQLEGLEDQGDWVQPVFPVPVADHNKSRTTEDFHEDVGTMGVGNVESVGRNSNPSKNGQACGMVNLVGVESYGHDGDREEVSEGKKNPADGRETHDLADDAGGLEHWSDVANVDVTPSKRHSVYRRGRMQIPGVRRKNLPWTAIEEDVLKEGIKLYSNNGEWGFQWKRILEFGFGKFHKSRTTVDLKDKWRNMVKGVSVD